MLHTVTVTWDDQAQVISWDPDSVPRDFAVYLACLIVRPGAARRDADPPRAPERAPCTCGSATTDDPAAFRVERDGIIHRFDRRPCHIASPGPCYACGHQAGGHYPWCPTGCPDCGGVCHPGRPSIR